MLTLKVFCRKNWLSFLLFHSYCCFHNYIFLQQAPMQNISYFQKYSFDSPLYQLNLYKVDMFSYVQPPNELIAIITNLLKIFCVLTIIMGIFRILGAQTVDASCIVYFISAFFYILSWRGLSYYYCLINQVLSLSIIINLLQEMAYLLENGLQNSYFTSQGFYKMGCLIFSIIFVYFNFMAYRVFKGLALQIYEYQQKVNNISE